MGVVPLLLIVTIGALAATDPRHPDAIEVFRAGFEQEADFDYDGWPDGWTREQGPAFPRYVSIAIDERSAVVGHSALRVTLNGGNAAAYGPPAPVGLAYSYVLEGHIETQGLKDSRAYLSLTFRDRKGKVLDRFKSDLLGGTADWKKVRLGPVTPRSPNVYTATIGIHLESATHGDLKGAAAFDDLWLGRLPRMALETNSRHNIYSPQDEIELTCHASGVTEKNPSVRFEILDAQRICVDEAVAPLEEVQSPEGRGREVLGTAAADFAGVAVWKPKRLARGYYQMTRSRR